MPVAKISVVAYCAFLFVRVVALMKERSEIKPETIIKAEKKLKANRKKLAEKQANFKSSIGVKTIKARGDNGAKTVAGEIAKLVQSKSAADLFCHIQELHGSTTTEER